MLHGGYGVSVVDMHEVGLVFNDSGGCEETWMAVVNKFMCILTVVNTRTPS